MATKNFKNNGVGAIKNVLINVINFVWKNAIRWIVAGLICVLWTAVCLLGLLTNPLWFPVCCINAPEATAISINSSFSKHEGKGLFNYFYLVLTVLFRICGWLYAPLIKVLPMKYRAEFIRNGKKRVCEYPVKTQVAYYKSHCDGSKQSLLSSSVFYAEAREAIWNDPSERKNWILSGLPLTKGQIIDMIKSGATVLLWGYFKDNTPNKETVCILCELAAQGHGSAQELLVKLICQQRPSKELIARILASGQTRFIERVNEILDSYADMDAVNFNVSHVDGKMSDEEKAKIVAERWANFCKVKKSISLTAQKKMNHAQFKVFIATGHVLEYYALLHLLLNVNDEDYLKDIIATELEQIKENKILSALKADYWRYSCYLAVVSKQNKNTAA